MEPSPLGGAMIDAWLERYSDLAAPPLAQCSYARRATANPCINPSAVRVGLRAPRRSPGPQYMPRSASPVGLARRVLRPPPNSPPDCCFYDPVVLEERFQLKIHFGTRQIPVYALAVAKNGPKLRPFQEGSCVP